ncbi:hypothetical protein BDF20DRAFT_186994 [Mycotypha africana]|uniref:uncharacterized protein n=1 Tax=Mycotypha africana TaxID=64632 RepID=UPI002301DAE2|nr:uncharacterized protein BDF20DRAFT_186994 [Mycotypha africana]KAI8968538.1 hypothetical protein BDF20DRAFT_186994 [Mycotypha africana]
MSQTKDTIELEGKLQTRRAGNRSPQAASPIMEDIKSPASPSAVHKNSEEPPQQEAGATTATPSSTPASASGAIRVTRSQSVESNGYETTDSRKRKRKAASKSNTSNKKRAESHSSASSNQINNSNGSSNSNKSTSAYNSHHDNERETRTSASRQLKGAKEAKKAEREVIIKERLRQLEEIEQAVKSGTHAEYHKLLHDIESKRAKMLKIAELRRSFAEGNVLNFFNSQKYAAYSQYYWDKLALRRSLIHQVQQKINLLEQEYYSNHVKSSLDDEHLSEWVPPDRPSMISSLTIGLTEEDADNDVEQARQDPNGGYYPPYANPSFQQQSYQYT